MSGNDFTWILVYAEVSDQYIPYVLYRNDMFQKRQIRSDIQIKLSEYDEMGGAIIWKSIYSEKTYRRFMSVDLFLCLMNNFDGARPFINGTTGVTCRLLLVSKRRSTQITLDAPSGRSCWHTMSPEPARRNLREPRLWSYGWRIHLKKLPRFKARRVDSFSVLSFLWACSTPNFAKW